MNSEPNNGMATMQTDANVMPTAPASSCGTLSRSTRREKL